MMSKRESKSIVIKSSSEFWSWQGLPDWIYVKKVDDGTALIIVFRNDGEEARLGEIVFVNGDLKRSVSIEQAARPMDYYFETEVKKIEFDDVNDPVDVKIDTNAKAWAVLEKPDWITITKSETGLTVQADKNLMEIERKGVVILEANEIRAQIEISQAPKAYVRLTEEPKVFHYLGGVQILPFETNRDIEIEAHPYNPVSAFKFELVDGNKLNVSCSINHIARERGRTLHFLYKGRSLLTVKFAQEKSNLAEDQRAYLIKFYHSTGGENWKNNTNWLSDKPISEWYGVSVRAGDDLNGGIYRITLPDNNLKGTIPEGFSILVGARFIKLQNNSLTGPIPKDLGDINEALFLYLQNNDLTGSIPPNICNLTSRGGIDLRWNKLTGILPDCFTEKRSARACPQKDGYKFDNYDCNEP
ncbi:BACON domain-containing carbohydrate-binding protein [Porphyromonas sp.]|uniref:BACON domain-containing protein n=1 Tax=Porphyromonas sp. TaxID=1924944 RepID=UPI0026DAF69A|nr:BACON domain-containing carbohydrate-binding protein [Porphyromonas sp.]MDO4770618.1 BACON domain-containing carbohydrate-binding protein [Porphyromonas sp.]